MPPTSYSIQRVVFVSAATLSGEAWGRLMDFVWFSAGSTIDDSSGAARLANVDDMQDFQAKHQALLWQCKQLRKCRLVLETNSGQKP